MNIIDKNIKPDNHSTEIPFIVLTNVDGATRHISINKDIITIGRREDLNDISLTPDPEKLVTRYNHCTIEIRKSLPYVIDFSKNGTFIKRNNVVQRINGEALLQDNDVIMILASTENDENNYWKLYYNDPQATVIIDRYNHELIYDIIEARLFIRNQNASIEITSITPLEHKLLRFMISTNIQNDNKSVICEYDDIIAALWDDKYNHTTNEVNHIIASLRKKIEFDPTSPRFLINERGRGYRLINKPKN